jgi:Mrp family chromosome partitioning ATPase
MDEKLNDFGYVVFDLPLATHLTACHSIASHMDGITLTVESNQIDQRQIGRFRRQLESQGVDIIGVVLNKA